ncbi:basic proline-rich protein [Lutra lutra]|uniref:basic proline-rich protein n=1 Tax=Lutra lutra TaxID=9657 RepID=UPI001FD47BF6|nr:basic proline-rich protein [Lutra lutra]
MSLGGRRSSSPAEEPKEGSRLLLSLDAQPRQQVLPGAPPRPPCTGLTRGGGCKLPLPGQSGRVGRCRPRVSSDNGPRKPPPGWVADPGPADPEAGAKLLPPRPAWPRALGSGSAEKRRSGRRRGRRAPPPAQDGPARASHAVCSERRSPTPSACAPADQPRAPVPRAPPHGRRARAAASGPGGDAAVLGEVRGARRPRGWRRRGRDTRAPQAAASRRQGERRRASPTDTGGRPGCPTPRSRWPRRPSGHGRRAPAAWRPAPPPATPPRTRRATRAAPPPSGHMTPAGPIAAPRLSLPLGRAHLTAPAALPGSRSLSRSHSVSLAKEEPEDKKAGGRKAGGPRLPPASARRSPRPSPPLPAPERSGLGGAGGAGGQKPGARPRGREARGAAAACPEQAGGLEAVTAALRAARAATTRPRTSDRPEGGTALRAHTALGVSETAGAARGALGRGSPGRSAGAVAVRSPRSGPDPHAPPTRRGPRTAARVAPRGAARARGSGSGLVTVRPIRGHRQLRPRRLAAAGWPGEGAGLPFVLSSSARRAPPPAPRLPGPPPGAGPGPPGMWWGQQAAARRPSKMAARGARPCPRPRLVHTQEKDPPPDTRPVRGLTLPRPARSLSRGPRTLAPSGVLGAVQRSAPEPSLRSGWPPRRPPSHGWGPRKGGSQAPGDPWPPFHPH